MSTTTLHRNWFRIFNFSISKYDVMMLLFVIAVFASTAFATTTGYDESLPFMKPLKTLTDVISGPLAGFLGLVGLVAIGANLIFGGEMGTFIKTGIYIVAAMALLVGGSKILTLVGGSMVIDPNITAEQLAELKSML